MNLCRVDSWSAAAIVAIGAMTNESKIMRVNR